MIDPVMSMDTDPINEIDFNNIKLSPEDKIKLPGRRVLLSRPGKVGGGSRRGQTYTFDIFTYFAQLTQLRRSQIWVVSVKLSSQFH